MFFASFVLYPQLIPGSGLQYVPAAVVASNDVGVFRVMKRIGYIRTVNITAVIRNAHFGPVGQWHMPAVLLSGVRFRQAEPQGVKAGLGIFAAEVELHPVTRRGETMQKSVHALFAFVFEKLAAASRK